MYKLPVIIIQVIMTNYLDHMATADSKWMVISPRFPKYKSKATYAFIGGLGEILFRPVSEIS